MTTRDVKIRDAGFSNRTLNVLTKAGVKTLGDIVDFADNRVPHWIGANGLRAVRGCGAATLLKIQAGLLRHGLDWPPEGQLKTIGNNTSSVSSILAMQREVTAERDALRVKLAERDAENASLNKRLVLANEALGTGTPWPVTEVLTRLCDATDHLLHDHSCDAHGYEGVGFAQAAGRRIVAALISQSPSGKTE